MKYRGRIWIGVVLAFAFVMWANAAYPCSTPVFRYALERWPADPYEIAVFHRGTPDAKLNAAVEKLRQGPGDGENRPNLKVTLFDLEGDVPKVLAEYLTEEAKSKLPWMMVFYPQGHSVSDPIWSGQLDDKITGVLVDSPLRREVARSLIEGDTAVWVLLECGDAKKDAAAAALIKTALEQTAKTLKFADAVDGEEDAQPLSAMPMKLSFAFKRLSRTDPAESMFVRMFLESESDLKTYNEPLAFPIYGRGRALYALVGKGVNADNVREACEFLVGPCSCQVKAGNPGTDLLMSVDWDRLIMGEYVVEEPLPPLSGLSGFSDDKAKPAAEAQNRESPGEIEEPNEAKPVASDTAAGDGAGGSGRLLIGVLVAALLLVSLVVVGAVMLRKGAA